MWNLKILHDKILPKQTYLVIKIMFFSNIIEAFVQFNHSLTSRSQDDFILTVLRKWTNYTVVHITIVYNTEIEPYLHHETLAQLQIKSTELLNELDSQTDQDYIWQANCLANFEFHKFAALDLINNIYKQSSQNLSDHHLSKLKYVMFVSMLTCIDHLEQKYNLQPGLLSEPVIQLLRTIYLEITKELDPKYFNKQNIHLSILEDYHFLECRLEPLQKRRDLLETRFLNNAIGFGTYKHECQIDDNLNEYIFKQTNITIVPLYNHSTPQLYTTNPIAQWNSLANILVKDQNEIAACERLLIKYTEFDYGLIQKSIFQAGLATGLSPSVLRDFDHNLYARNIPHDYHAIISNTKDYLEAKFNQEFIIYQEAQQQALAYLKTNSVPKAEIGSQNMIASVKHILADNFALLIQNAAYIYETGLKVEELLDDCIFETDSTTDEDELEYIQQLKDLHNLTVNKNPDCAQTANRIKEFLLQHDNIKDLIDEQYTHTARVTT